MVKLLFTAVIAASVATAACGGSPTSPQPISPRSVADVSAPTGPATPPDPAPALPVPPAPIPAPAPAPAPTNPVETWHATVDVQHASSPAAELPATFTITVSGDRIHFGPLEATILAREGTHLYARNGVALTIQIDGNAWTVTSADLFASGTLTY